MSKKVEVSLLDGSIKYVTNSIAFAMRREGDAVFTDDTLMRMQIVPPTSKPRGYNNRFDELWSIEASAGVPVWQYNSPKRHFEPATP